jgi:hypothetical protein
VRKVPDRASSVQLTVHEMIDLFDGIDNDALLLDDCNGNPAPHHWLGDGYCDDASDIEDGGLDCELSPPFAHATSPPAPPARTAAPGPSFFVVALCYSR